MKKRLHKRVLFAMLGNRRRVTPQWDWTACEVPRSAFLPSTVSRHCDIPFEFGPLISTMHAVTPTLRLPSVGVLHVPLLETPHSE
jgi:hypothetical protein